MIIQCTKELLKIMKREPEPIPDGEPVDPLYIWNATLYRMGRNRMMVLQNSMGIIIMGILTSTFRIRREKHISFAMMVSLWDLQCSAHTQILSKILITRWLNSRYFRHFGENIWRLMQQK